MFRVFITAMDAAIKMTFYWGERRLRVVFSVYCPKSNELNSKLTRPTHLDKISFTKRQPQDIKRKYFYYFVMRSYIIIN